MNADGRRCLLQRFARLVKIEIGFPRTIALTQGKPNTGVIT